MSVKVFIMFSWLLLAVLMARNQLASGAPIITDTIGQSSGSSQTGSGGDGFGWGYGKVSITGLNLGGVRRR